MPLALLLLAKNCCPGASKRGDLFVLNGRGEGWLCKSCTEQN